MSYTYPKTFTLDSNWWKMMSDQTRKYDGDKPRPSLIPVEALDAMMIILEYGATLYDVDSWRLVPGATKRYVDALERHMMAWRKGEQYDEETGAPHIWHALTCMAFLVSVEGKQLSSGEVVNWTREVRRRAQAIRDQRIASGLVVTPHD